MSSGILSKIWKEKRKLNLTEKIIQENTFIQQTSGGQKLWKVQLGETENLVVFLQKEREGRVLLHLAPKHDLRMVNCPGRCLHVPPLAYFRLPPGCGAWAPWRALGQRCQSASNKGLAPRTLLLVLVPPPPTERALPLPSPPLHFERAPLVRRSRVIRRFGEGIPDGCTFNLTLCSDYPGEEGDAAETSLRNRVPQIGPFHYLQPK